MEEPFGLMELLAKIKSMMEFQLVPGQAIISSLNSEKNTYINN
jgi:hypothetical protein